MSENKKEAKQAISDAGMEIRKPVENIIEGAKQEDQLEKLKPQSEEQKNKREDQAGREPIDQVNKGE